jgi:hypothetical protein
MEEPDVATCHTALSGRPNACDQATANPEATPLVGRDEELDLLLSRWQQAKAGQGARDAGSLSQNSLLAGKIQGISGIM